MTDYRIVIIDQDQASTKFLGYELSKAGYQVFTANDVKEGMILAYQNRPHVIILDPNLPDISPEEFLNKLKKDRRVARSKVIAFSSLTNPEDIQAAIEMGFDHYLAKEGDALPALLQSVKENIKGFQTKLPTTEETTAEPAPVQGDGKTIVFLSAKGGTGTSSICANLAHMFNEREEHNIVVVDLVLPIGSIASIVGYTGELNIVEAAAMTSSEASLDYLRDSLPRPENWNFQLLAGSPNPAQANELDISRIPILFDTLKRAFDYVFIDFGRSLSRISMPIIQSADQIVLILSLDEATATLTNSVWDYLKSNGVRREQVYPFINRAVGLEGFSKSEVEEKLGLVIPNAIPFMGRNFTLANNQHQPILNKFPDDAATIAIRQAVQQVKQRADKAIRSLEF